MYADPLTSRNGIALQSVEFEKEILEIIKNIKRHNLSIKYNIGIFNRDTLVNWETNTEAPRILHISCHGCYDDDEK